MRHTYVGRRGRETDVAAPLHDVRVRAGVPMPRSRNVVASRRNTSEIAAVVRSDATTVPLG